MPRTIDAPAIRAKQVPRDTGPMTKRPASASDLACGSCGQLPRPGRTRLTAANVAAMLPIELLVHAAVLQADLPYLSKVLLLTVTATVLVIWVAEPSARRLLHSWLHGPALRQRSMLAGSGTLWRARVVLVDTPGALEDLAHALARSRANILSITSQPVPGGVMDELVVSGPPGLREHDVAEALADGGAGSVLVWPTTALALADGQTKALALGARVAANPQELGRAVSELLAAELVVDPSRLAPGGPEYGTPVLKVPTAWDEALRFIRPGEPFTPAESARASRLAEIAETVELRTARPG